MRFNKDSRQNKQESQYCLTMEQMINVQSELSEAISNTSLNTWAFLLVIFETKKQPIGNDFKKFDDTVDFNVKHNSNK